MLRPEPLPRLAVERDHHDRAPVALGQARGDDPDHAGVPALPGQHVGRRARRARRSALRPRSGCASRPAGARGWRGRAPAAICARARRILGQDQLERRVGAVQAPGGVQPRRQREGDRALVRRLPGIDPRDRHQRAQPGLGGGRQRAQPAPHERAVLAHAAPPRRRSSPAPPGRDPPPGARASRASRARAARRCSAAPGRACRRPPSRTAPGTGSRRRGMHDRRVAAARRRRAARGGR